MLLTKREEGNSKRADGKLLLLEISISRNCSLVKCQNVHVQFHNWVRLH